MLRVSNLEKYYAGVPILLGVSFTVGHGERAGIVGPNGSGKTTLLRIIAGLERPDAGSVALATGARRLGYLRQGFLGDEDRPVAAMLHPDGAAWAADLDALRWLEGFLARYRGAVLLVSHDRAFLDATVGTVLELDGHTHTITPYAGGYTAYATARRAELAAQWEAYKRQERRRERVEEDIRETRSHALHTERATRDSSARRLSNKVMRKAIVRERKLEKELEESSVEKPKAGWNLKLDFAPAAKGAREVRHVEGLRKGFDGRTVLAGVDLHLRHGERVVLTGPNGGGKSTPLKSICGAMGAGEGGGRP